MSTSTAVIRRAAMLSKPLTLLYVWWIRSWAPSHVGLSLIGAVTLVAWVSVV